MTARARAAADGHRGRQRWDAVEGLADAELAVDAHPARPSQDPEFVVPLASAPTRLGIDALSEPAFGRRPALRERVVEVQSSGFELGTTSYPNGTNPALERWADEPEPRGTLDRVLPALPALPFDPALSAEGLSLVVRFGSSARGTARHDSDLDLGVLRADGARLSHRELGALRLTLSDRYDAPADIVDLRTADALLRREVIRDGQVLHADGRDAWTNLVARTLIELDDLGPMLGAGIDGVLRAARAAAGRAP